jgi:hypothetical protein
MKAFIIVFTAVFLLNAGISGQDNTTNSKYTNIENKEEYATKEAELLGYINWLSNTRIDSNKTERRNAQKIIYEWGKETPTMLLFPYCRVSNSIFADLKDKDKSSRYGIELFMSYYSGMIRYEIENKNTNNLHDAQLAGIQNVLRLYELNADILTDSKAVSQFIELKKTDGIQKWIDKRISRMELKTYRCFYSINCSGKRTAEKPVYPELSF